MFNMFKKTAKSINKVDIHSHLLPQIDDGAKNIKKSIELISKLYSLGYEKLIITPHINDIYKNDKQTILNGYYSLNKEIQKQNINIKLEIGAEYYADDHFKKLLEKEKLLSFGKKNYLLFEFSYFSPPRDIENLIYDIILKGYTPILAHPERYLYFHNEFHMYKELKEMGVLFQINLNSIGGYYNKNVKIIVEKLIKNSLVDFVGSDTHHSSHLKSLEKVLLMSIYSKMFKTNKILNDTLISEYHQKSNNLAPQKVIT